MPARRRVSAPVSRVYESGPALHQAKFQSPPVPAKKKRIRSYGKKTTVRVPKPKDNTLTQMGFVMDNSPPDMSEDDEDGAELEEVDGDADGDGDGGYDDAAAKRVKKRRRTMGDEPSKATTPNFHTQTISQVVRSFNSNHEMEDEEEEEDEEEKVEVVQRREKDIYDMPSSSPQVTRQSKTPLRRGRSAAPGKENLHPAASARVREVVSETVPQQRSPDRSMMPPPQTPHRTRALEIPSSQSPATPLTLPSHQSVRSALRETTSNIPIDFGVRQTPQGNSALSGRQDDPSSTSSTKPTSLPPFFDSARASEESVGMEGEIPAATPQGKPIDTPLFWNPNLRRNADISPEKVPKLEIKDTFDTTTDTSQMTRIASSPVLMRSSPAKNVRFLVPNESEEIETTVGSVASDRVEPHPPSTRTIKTEILDSDAESDDEDLVELADEEAVASPEARENETNNDVPVVTETEDTNENDESQFEVDIDVEPDVPMDFPESTSRVVESQEIGGSPDLDAESDYGNIGVDTQFQVEQLVNSSCVNETPEEPHYEETAPETFAEKSQYMATQRLNTQHINNMAARTGESDVFISMSGAELTTVLDRSRNHIIRNWKLAPRVCRIWIYETQPVSAVQYMVEISPAKRPGELPDEGLGNEGFNIRPANTTYSAYEILQVYELLDPVQLATLLERGWFENPPKRWERVAPAVIDELVCNLKPPLFSSQDEDEEEEEAEMPQSSETDAQEVTGQLLSNIQQYTQPAARHEEDEIVSSPFLPPAPRVRAPPVPVTIKQKTEDHDDHERILPPPSQATTVDLSQTQTPRHRRQRSIEIIMESPSRPTPFQNPSSTPLQLPRHRTPRGSGRERGGRRIKDEPDLEPESLVPYSMDSSQLRVLTRSQLLSESLLQDSVPGPPEWVGDTEDEDEDYAEDDDDL